MSNPPAMFPTAQTITLSDSSFFELILVEAGSFLMGSEASEREKPIHEVALSSFYLGKYPVNQALWKAVMGMEILPFAFPGDRRPAERISWFDAIVFCNRLNEQQNLTPSYYADPGFRQVYGKAGDGWELPNKGEVFFNRAANGFRLPTEAEWEFAARGGIKSERYEYAGSNRLKEVGWYADNSYGETKPVGMKAPNELGLYDMSGNVFEWVEDQWHENYDGAPPDGSAWVDREGSTSRVLRGGSWDSVPQYCRCTSRYDYVPQYRNPYYGFRLVLPFQFTP